MNYIINLCQVANYKISFEELEEGTTYSTNIVTHKKRFDNADKKLQKLNEKYPFRN